MRRRASDPNGAGGGAHNGKHGDGGVAKQREQKLEATCRQGETEAAHPGQMVSQSLSRRRASHELVSGVSDEKA
jgi:hypothetical protein